MKATPNTPLIEVICLAMKPKGVRERLRLQLSGGYTAKQILYRLPTVNQKSLVPENTHPSQIQSAALIALNKTLTQMRELGIISRKSVNIQEQDGRGVRRIQIDVYRIKNHNGWRSNRKVN